MDTIIKLFKGLLEALLSWWKKENAVPVEVDEDGDVIPILDPEPDPSKDFKQGEKNYFNNESNLVIDGYKYKGGGVALTFRGHCKNITIKNCEFEGVSKAILIDRAKGATIDGLIIENCKIFDFSKSLLDCAPNCKNIKINNCSVNSNYNWSENFVMGVVIREDCDNVYIGNSTFKNFVYNGGSIREGKYLNGDAIAIEWRCKNLIMENLSIEKATDAGIDTKSGGIFRNIYIKQCKRAFRAWDKNVVYDFQGTNKFEDCNSKSTYNWLAEAKPGISEKISKITGGAGIWKRYKEVSFQGLETISFINTSNSIKMDK